MPTRKPGLDTVMKNIIMRDITTLGTFTLTSSVRPINFFLFFRCTGSEYYLASCRMDTGRVAERCGHGRDVGVECTVPKPCDLKDKVHVHACASACSFCPVYTKNTALADHCAVALTDSIYYFYIHVHVHISEY